MPITVDPAANEKSSSVLTFKFVDYDGIGINVANIATAKMTLTLKGTNTVINGRRQIDVKDKFNATGDFSFELAPLDNIIVSKSKGRTVEYHVATFEFVTVGPNSITYNEELIIKVNDLEMISGAFSGVITEIQTMQGSLLIGAVA